MLSTFHVSARVWLPDRLTLVFGARVNFNVVVEKPAASAAPVATAP
jgi:hypothetical protein